MDASAFPLPLQDPLSRAIFDQMFQLMGILDTEGRVRDVNRTALDRIHTTMEEVRGKFFWDTPWWSFSEESRTRLRDAVRRAALGEHVRYRADNVDADGRRYTVDFSLRPIKDESGAIRYLLPEGRDITDLLSKEAEINAIVESSRDWVWSMDRDGVYRYCNNAVRGIVGLGAESFMGRAAGDHIHPDDRTEWKTFIARSAEKGTGWTRKGVRWLHADGSTKYLESTAVPIMESGELTGFRGVDRDVTGRVVGEKRIEESERTYRFIFQDGPAIQMLLDENLTFVDCNKAAERLLGRTREELLETSALAFVSEDLHEALRERIKNRLAGREVAPMEIPILTADGTVRTLLPQTTSLRLERHGRNVVLATGLDITELKAKVESEKAMERELQQTAKLASMGTLASGIAHEINNPNNYIHLNAQNILDFWNELEPRLTRAAGDEGMIRSIPIVEVGRMVRRMLEGILAGSHRVDRLTRSLREYAQPDASESLEMVSLAQVIESALVIIGDLVRKSTTRFSTDLRPGLPPVRARYHQIEQVIINLLTNACQALTDQSQGISIRTDLDEGRKHVVVEVRDEGRGIPERNMSKIMDPFFTTRRGSGGTGLGLSVCQRIVEDHKGQLSFTSREGEGTTAALFLPVTQ